MAFFGALAGALAAALAGALAATALKIAVSCALLPSLGFTGAAIGSLAGFILYFVLSAVRARKTLLFTLRPRTILTVLTGSVLCGGTAALLCRMIRGRIGLIAAHTNFDAAAGGTSDTLASLCRLRNVRGEGEWWRVGDLPEGTTLGSLRALLESGLRTAVRVYGQFPPEHPLRRLGICAGGGSDEWPETAALGADAFLTGEIKHHHALAMVDAGVVGLEAGHFATEEPGIFALADALQKRSDALQWKVRITRSACGGYALPR